MDDIEILEEKKRIAQNRLDANIKLTKRERVELEDYIQSLKRGIECIKIVEEGNCQNGK